MNELREKVEEIIESKAMEWYPYGDRVPMPKQIEILSKSIASLIEQEVLKASIERDMEMQDYYGLANVVCGFVDLKPEHPLYESIRQDVLHYLDRLKGKSELKEVENERGE